MLDSNLETVFVGLLRNHSGGVCVEPLCMNIF
jgi:hypothetical protein